MSISMPLPAPTCLLFPYTTLFRSPASNASMASLLHVGRPAPVRIVDAAGTEVEEQGTRVLGARLGKQRPRSEEHTSELQSQFQLVCRLLLEKKNGVFTCPEKTWSA